MSRIRVVFSIGAMHGGGSERQLVSLLRHLDRVQFEPFLYLVYRSGPLLDLVPNDVQIASFEERVTPSRIYLPGLMHSLRVKDFAKFLHEVGAHVSYDRTFLMTLISAAGAQQIGVPNVSTIVTDPETGFTPVAGRFQWIKRRKLHQLYNRSAQVLAVSDGAREAAIRFYGIRPAKIQTFHNGVDVDLLYQQAEHDITMSNPDVAAWWQTGGSNIIRIVTAGRLNEQKGFHLLLKAIDCVRNNRPDVRLKLCILGDGPWRDRLMQITEQLGLSDHVRMPGFQSHAASWYRLADVFVLPSLIEGMPNVLLEAMALHVPVISTDCPSGPREILKDGRLGQLVQPPAEADAMAAAIEHFINHRQEANDRALKALDAIQSEFSIAAAARKLEKLFVSVTSRR